MSHLRETTVTEITRTYAVGWGGAGTTALRHVRTSLLSITLENFRPTGQNRSKFRKIIYRRADQSADGGRPLCSPSNHSPASSFKNVAEKFV